MTSATPLVDRWSSVPGWKDLSSVYSEIRPDLDRVEDRLESWSRSANPLTAEISRYVLRKKGKRSTSSPSACRCSPATSGSSASSPTSRPG